MVAQAIRNIISPKSVIAQYQKIDFSNKGTIPIRHLNIGFDGKEIDIEFYVNNQFATLFFATLSVFDLW